MTHSLTDTRTQPFIVKENRFLENLIRATSKMSGTHSKLTVASVASQAEPVENLLSGLYKVINLIPSLHNECLFRNA